MRRFRFIIPFLFALVCVSCHRTRNALQTNEPPPRVYLAIFSITVGSDAHVQDFDLIKVIEPLSGANEAVDLELPPAYLEAAKKTAEAAHLKPTLKGNPSRTLTAFTYIPGASKAANSSAPRMSLESLDGLMAEVTSFELMGTGCQASLFGKPIGSSSLFLTYYAVPLTKGSEAERAAVINAEIERCCANFGGAKVISRKVLPLANQSIVEVTVKSPKSKVLTLRCRVICTTTQMLALTAVTPDDLSAAAVQSLDWMFDQFRVK